MIILHFMCDFSNNPSFHVELITCRIIEPPSVVFSLGLLIFALRNFLIILHILGKFSLHLLPMFYPGMLNLLSCCLLVGKFFI